MNITTLSGAIKARLQAAQMDGSNLFHEVIAAPQDSVNDFGGFPSCTFFYDVTDPDYATVSENRREVTFSIYIYAVSQTKTLEEQYAWMYKLVDAAVDELDRSDDLGLADVMVRPVPADMSRIESERGNGLLANIRLVCAFDAMRV